MAMVKGGTFPVVLCLTDEETRQLQTVLLYAQDAHRGWADTILHKLIRARQAAEANARSMLNSIATRAEQMEWFPKPPTITGAPGGINKTLAIMEQAVIKALTPIGPMQLDGWPDKNATPPPTVEQAIAEALCDTPFTTQAPHHDTKGDQR